MNKSLSLIAALFCVLGLRTIDARADSAFQITTDAALISTIGYDSFPSVMTPEMIDQIQNGGCIPMGTLFSDSGLRIYWRVVGTMTPGTSLHMSFNVCNDPPPAGQTRNEDFQFNGYTTPNSYYTTGTYSGGFNSKNNVTVVLKTPTGKSLAFLFGYYSRVQKQSYFSLNEPPTGNPVPIVEPGLYTVEVTNLGKLDLHTEFALPLSGFALSAQ